jgi:acylphosphatase
MKRLTAHISGNVQRVGYRARTMDLARAFSLKGAIQNLSDGRVKIIAEGEENDLEKFLKAIDIKNTVIYVSSISKEYSEATGEFESFYKLVEPGETDSRLDTAAVYLKELIVAVNKMNDNLGGKIDDARADIVGEIRELRHDIKEEDSARIKNDIAAIKAKLGL